MLKKFGLPALVLGTVIGVLSPVAVLAQEHRGGERGNSGGQRFSGGGQNFSGRGYNGGGQSYNNGGGRNYYGGGQNFNSGRSFSGRDYYGGRGYDRGRNFEGDRGRGWDRDRGFRDRDDRFRYNGGRGYSFGFYGAPYYYSAPYYDRGSCNPSGYYDRWGNWRYYPGCYVDPYYPY